MNGGRFHAGASRNWKLCLLQCSQVVMQERLFGAFLDLSTILKIVVDDNKAKCENIVKRFHYLP